jgi:protein gp37
MAQSSQSELIVVTRAKELCSYVMTVTQKSPKHFRFTFVTRLQNLTLNVIENIYRANDIFFGGKHGAGQYAERLEHQRKALTDIRILAYFAFLAMEQQCILPKQYEQIAKLSTDCQHLLGAWINSDKKRLPPSGSAL